MKRILSALIAASAAALLGAAAEPSSSPPSSLPLPNGQQIVAPLPPEAQRDWDCLDAAMQDWGVHPTGMEAGSVRSQKELRTYYLGRLSVEIGDERLERYLREARLQPSRATTWTSGLPSTCLAQMERSNAAVRPMESGDFTLQRSASPTN